MVGHCYDGESMFKHFALGLTLAAMISGPALAADLFDEPAEVSFKDAPVAYGPTLFWVGLYAGGHIGYAFGNSNSSISSDDGGFFENPSNELRELSFDTEGFLAGGQLGYNWQIGQFVVGLEGDAGYIGADGGGENVIGGLVSEDGETEYGAYGVLAARAGLAHDRSLFYLKGGLALANVETVAADLDDGVDVVEDDRTTLDETLYGYAIGGGLEFALSSRWTFKGEYLYFDFDEETSTNAQGDTFEHENELHTVKLGVNYKFNESAPASLK